MHFSFVLIDFYCDDLTSVIDFINQALLWKINQRIELRGVLIIMSF